MAVWVTIDKLVTQGLQTHAQYSSQFALTWGGDMDVCLGMSPGACYVPTQRHCFCKLYFKFETKSRKTIARLIVVCVCV